MYLVSLWIFLFVPITSSFEPGVAVVKTVAGGGDVHIGEKSDCVDEKRTMDGVGSDARFNYPWGIAYDGITHSLYVADCGCPNTKHSNDRIRAINLPTLAVATLAGARQGYLDGKGIAAQFFHSAGMCVHHRDRQIFIADSGNNCVRRVSINTGDVITFVGSRQPGFQNGVGQQAGLYNPQGICLDEGRDILYIADTDNHLIRRVLLLKRLVHTIAGQARRKGNADGYGDTALFYHPTGLAYDSTHDILYVTDHYNHLIRRILYPDTNPYVSTLAGSVQGYRDGTGILAHFNYPEGVAFDRIHRVLYVADFDNNAVRIVHEDGHVTTLAGGQQGALDGIATEATFYHPTGLTFDATNNTLYITDQYNHKIRSITTLGATISLHQGNRMPIYGYGMLLTAVIVVVAILARRRELMRLVM
ncbi:NHL repeat-containing protein 2-like [Corticium candelabrum]|uniref:NHL repeat-containing protein 2-like n=1 Tax=Corticium candelabrum TaxID=121492 RepID=UPI002E257CB8|nr:NHL repeat-containing protein 2-like [Corticium candelabrum]